MTNSETVTISTELLDLMVDALTRRPFSEVAPIFDRLGQELNQAQAKPTIVT